MPKTIVRRIVQIDEDACIGCELCVTACHEGAIVMQNGKARLLREDYCDGLGDCLPACPVGAITFETREAAVYDEEAVKAHLAQCGGHGCPGTRVETLKTDSAAPAAEGEAGSAIPAGTSSLSAVQRGQNAGAGKALVGEGAGQGGDVPGAKPGQVSPVSAGSASPAAPEASPSELRQWPVQIKLVPVNAGFFHGADVLVAADCTGFACGDFHSRYMRGRVTLIGCTKLDDADYASKLADIFTLNDIRSITVTRMDVPCCGGMEHAVREALRRSGKDIPLHVVTLGRDGRELAPVPSPLLSRL